MTTQNIPAIAPLLLGGAVFLSLWCILAQTTTPRQRGYKSVQVERGIFFNAVAPALGSDFLVLTKCVIFVAVILNIKIWKLLEQ